jgi:hypothetical protein
METKSLDELVLASIEQLIRDDRFTFSYTIKPKPQAIDWVSRICALACAVWITLYSFGVIH